MQLDQLLGNTEFKQSIQAALQSGRLPHAVLLSAPDGSGRGFAARCLAADYLYPAGGQGAHAVMLNQSSEVLLVQGEGKSGQIPVDSVRAMRQNIYHSSLSAAGRVVWIRDANRMAAPAFNALLKVLEEPPAGALFILTTPSSSAIPLTIQSRCAHYPLTPVPLQQCEQALRATLPQGKDPRLPALLANLYGGRLGLGLKALQNDDRMQVLQDALQFAQYAAEPNRYRMLRILAAYEGRADGDREKREALLDDTTNILEFCLLGLSAAGIPPIQAASAAKLLPPLSQARLALRSNVAPKLTFAALAVHMARALQA